MLSFRTTFWLCHGEPAARRRWYASRALSSSCVAAAGVGGRPTRKGATAKTVLELSRKNWLYSLSPSLQQDEEDTASLDPTTSDVVVPPNALVFGIDPDVSGAMAVLNGNDTSNAQVFDAPSLRVLVGLQQRRRHDTSAIVKMIANLNVPPGSIAYIEQSTPLPKDGKQGWWGSGFGYGVWIGTLVALGVSVIPVPSQAWKRAMGLSGRTITKDDCRACASSIFPALAPQLKRKKDHGRAEALLIAAHGVGLTPPKWEESNPDVGSNLVSELVTRRE